MGYLESKFAMEVTLKRQIRVIDMFAHCIRGTVLEWGCQHGLDSCVLRMRFGETLDLHSCDVVEEAAYKPFYEFSGTKYKKINHDYLLDYEEGTFDVVLSNGVLEHVPDDRASVREIHRVLKPKGLFIVTCLPNRWSYTEAFQRYRAGPHHERLYTLKAAKSMLAAEGFETTEARYFFMVPTMLQGFPRAVRGVHDRLEGILWLVNDGLEHLWPINRLASNLLVVARKK